METNASLERVLAAAIAVVGGVVGLALTPPMAAIWAYDPPSTSWASMPWVERTFGPSLESRGALSFEWGALGPYEIYGKGFFLVYLAMAPIVRLVHHRYRTRGGASLWALRAGRVMWLSLIAAAATDFVSYWGVSVPGPVGAALWSGGFIFESLASALLLVATTAYGLISCRLRIVPMWTSLLLAAVLPLAVVSLGFVVGYVPNGYAVPLSLIWAAYGVELLVCPRSALV